MIVAAVLEATGHFYQDDFTMDIFCSKKEKASFKVSLIQSFFFFFN